MSELVADCPRCGARKITFDIRGNNNIFSQGKWQNRFEVFCACRCCNLATIFIAVAHNEEFASILINRGFYDFTGALNDYLEVIDYISQKDNITYEPPGYLPDNILSAFKEGATCLTVGCYNATGTMFRLCLDLATKPLLPQGDTTEPNEWTRRNLGPRLNWLFDNDILPKALRELSTCVKEDGNDGAHAGTLSKDDADNLLEFTSLLLERMFTEPAKLGTS